MIRCRRRRTRRKNVDDARVAKDKDPRDRPPWGSPRTFGFDRLDIVEVDLVPVFVPLSFFSPGQDGVKVRLEPHLRRFAPRAESKSEGPSLEQVPLGREGRKAAGPPHQKSSAETVVQVNGRNIAELTRSPSY